MFDHLGLTVADLTQSVVFYTRTLASLGHVLASQGEGYAGFGPADAPMLWLYQGQGKRVGAAHVALRAADRQSVERFHQAGLAAGGRDNGAPGLRPDYAPNYYAAFLIDPDGNNIEAVCFA